jgi:hypothetical protein
MKRGAILVLVACGGGTKPGPTVPPDNQGEADKPPAGATWEVPAGWKSETIPFPLAFAPGLAHTGVEELRFPPGFFVPESPEYWSYAFVWRTTDEAMLHGVEMGEELTAYFRGLLAAVDKDKNNIKAPDEIIARAMDMAHPAEDRGDIQLALRVHVFDAFGTGQAIDLSGTAKRTSCPDGGALWTFILTPNDEMRGTLAVLAAAATCDQRAL